MEIWKVICNSLEASVSISYGFHPQLNIQTKHINLHQLKPALRCVNNNLSSWSTHLSWKEYAHNTLTTAATVFWPFDASLGYQPPQIIFQESENVVLSVQHHLISLVSGRDVMLSLMAALYKPVAC